MITGDALCTASWRARPGSFLALMTLYESNYIRLRDLCGNLALLPQRGCARVDPGIELQVRIEERGPYTTLLRLRLQTQPGVADGEALPQLGVRVYHDARVVEAADVRFTTAPTGQLPVSGEALAPRWSRNMMLNKWLEYCADRGCRFTPLAE